MDILVGSKALVMLYKYYTGKDLGIRCRDTDYLSTDNTRVQKGVDYIRLGRCPYQASLVDLIDYESMWIEIDGIKVASPMNLLLTYIGRRLRFNYDSLKVYKDIDKQRCIYEILFQEIDHQQLKLLEDNDRYHDDWTLHYINHNAYMLNFIKDEFTIGNGFAILFYFEHFLKKLYLCLDDIELYGDKSIVPSVINDYTIKIIGDSCDYNQIDLHGKHFKIESIESLLCKNISELVSTQLIYIKDTYKLK